MAETFQKTVMKDLRILKNDVEKQALKFLEKLKDKQLRKRLMDKIDEPRLKCLT